MPVDQFFELGEIDAAVFAHGGDQCDQAACQHSESLCRWLEKKRADCSVSTARCAKGRLKRVALVFQTAFCCVFAGLRQSEKEGCWDGVLWFQTAFGGLLFGFFGEKAAQFLHGFGFDLADALGGDAVFGGKLVEGEAAVVLQPAGFDDASAAVVEFGEGVLQAFGLQGVVGFLFDLAGGLGFVVGQPVDGGEAVFVVAVVGEEGDVFAGHALFHFHDFGQFDAEVVGDGLGFFRRQGGQGFAHGAQVEEEFALGFGGGDAHEPPVS